MSWRVNGEVGCCDVDARMVAIRVVAELNLGEMPRDKGKKEEDER